MASLTLSLPGSGRRWWRLRPEVVYCTLALLLVAALVFWPFVLVMINSFQVARPGQPPEFSLQAWHTALGDDRILSSLWNTFTVAITTHVLAFVAAVPLAWLLTRTDLPGRNWLEFLFWIAFFLPAIPVTQGWILLLDPHYGIINELLKKLPFIHSGVFNIFSFWGIIWAHVAHDSTAIKVVLLVPAFQNLDAALEEASLMAGASRFGTLVRILVPLLLPIIAVVMLLSLISSLQSFEIEMVLGLPFRFLTFSTLIYELVQIDPPLYAEATVLATIILGVVVPLIVLQRWLIGRKQYTTVSGQFRQSMVRLRRWRLPAFLLVLGAALTCTLLPFSMLLMGTFMKLFGFFNLPQPWTFDQWSTVLFDPVFLSSLRNTFVLAFSVAVLGVILFALITYITQRTRYRARGSLDFISWLPSALPGIILSLGLLWLFVGSPVLRPLYGSILVLVVGVLIAHMTLGVQTIKGVIVQLGMDIEEAARVAGGSWLSSLRHVILPLLAPVLLLVAAVNFVTAAGDVSTVALLSTNNTRPLSMLQLEYVGEGHYEAGAVVGVIVVVLTTGVALLARLVASRYGLRTAREPA